MRLKGSSSSAIVEQVQSTANADADDLDAYEQLPLTAAPDASNTDTTNQGESDHTTRIIWITYKHDIITATCIVQT